MFTRKVGAIRLTLRPNEALQSSSGLRLGRGTWLGRRGRRSWLELETTVSEVRHLTNWTLSDVQFDNQSALYLALSLFPLCLTSRLLPRTNSARIQHITESEYTRWVVSTWGSGGGGVSPGRVKTKFQLFVKVRISIFSGFRVLKVVWLGRTGYKEVGTNQETKSETRIGSAPWLGLIQLPCKSLPLLPRPGKLFIIFERSINQLAVRVGDFLLLLLLLLSD